MQQSSFCVFSGKGVLQLRAFLTELFDHMTEMNGTDDTEYEEDDFEPDDEMPDPDIGEVDDEDTVQELGARREDPSTAGGHQLTRANQNPPQLYEYTRQPQSSTVPSSSSRGGNVGPYTTGQGFANPSAGPAWRPRDQHHPVTSVADNLPIIERNNSASPSASDIASNRSGGTNNSNGATFFRTYQDANVAQPTFMVRNEGALTPDLDSAEIGHGRGMQTGSHGSNMGYRSFLHTGVQQSLTGHHHHHRVSDAVHSVDQYSSSGELGQPWPHQESSTQGSSYSLLVRDGREGATAACNDRRGRSVRKTIRNKLNAAEHYASSFFGRSAPDDDPGRGGGSRPEPYLL